MIAILQLIVMKEKMALLQYFQKTEKTLNEHLQEVSNDKNLDAGLSRVESELVAETLKAVKSVKYLNRNLTFEKIT